MDESRLTKGQLRKLNALRKSVGEEIGERAFADWLERQGQVEQQGDRTADMIASAVWDMLQRENISLPRGGYIVRRGRGRVIVEPAKSQ